MLCIFKIIQQSWNNVVNVVLIMLYKGAVEWMKLFHKLRRKG